MALYTTAIQQLYVAYFSRPADAGGLEWWEGVVANAKGDTSMISAEFAKSNEYRQTFAGKNNFEVVRTVYINLFGREPEKAGVDYWSGALDKGLMTIDVVVTEIAKGAQNEDLKAFNNKVTAATAFTAALDTHPERTAYNGDEAQNAAKAFIRTVTTDASLADAIQPAKLAASVAAFVAASLQSIEFTLTPNADAGVAFTGGGGTDIFHATSATLNAGDALHGGNGVDTLIVDDVNAGGLSTLPAGMSMTAIEHVTLRSGAGIGSAAAAYDLSGQADVVLLAAHAKGAVNVKIHDKAEAYIGTTAGAVTVTGGHSVRVSGNTGAATLTGNAITTVRLENSNQNAVIANATAGHTLNLLLDKITGGATVTDAAATTVNLLSTIEPIARPAAGIATEQSTAGVNVNLDIAKATALNITNEGPLTLVTTALAAADTLQSITLKGTGGGLPSLPDFLKGITPTMQADLSGILPFKSFDASLYTGNTSIKVASASNLVVKGGLGADHVVMTGRLTGTASVQLGAGNDIYDFSQAALAGAKVDGGEAGNDIIVVNDAVLLDTEGQVFTNFETLNFSSGKGKYNLDKAGSVTMLNASKVLREDVEFVNGRANSSINLLAETTNYNQNGDLDLDFVPHGNISFSLKDASGSNDALTISLTGQDAKADGKAYGVVQAASIKAENIETINLHSAVSVTESGVKASSYFNAISYLYIDGAKTLSLTGNASLSLSNIYASTLTLFDASGSSGNIDFGSVINNSDTTMTRLTYLGSNGKDELDSSDVGIVFQGNGGGDEVMMWHYDQVADIIRFNKASDSFITIGAGIETGTMDTYSGFQAGLDKIDLSGLKLAAGANRDSITLHSMYSNNTAALRDVIGNGQGFFNDGGTNRSLAFGNFGGNDGFLMVDVNGDGNFSSEVDLIILMYSNTAALKVTDFIWG